KSDRLVRASIGNGTVGDCDGDAVGGGVVGAVVDDESGDILPGGVGGEGRVGGPGVIQGGRGTSGTGEGPGVAERVSVGVRSRAGEGDDVANGCGLVVTGVRDRHSVRRLVDRDGDGVGSRGVGAVGDREGGGVVAGEVWREGRLGAQRVAEAHGRAVGALQSPGVYQGVAVVIV